MSDLVRHQRVEKTSGYAFPGVVVSVFTNLAGDTRYVVEHRQSPGLLHIFNATQIEAADVPE
jgi:hypothetical protein